MSHASPEPHHHRRSRRSAVTTTVVAVAVVAVAVPAAWAAFAASSSPAPSSGTAGSAAYPTITAGALPTITAPQPGTRPVAPAAATSSGTPAASRSRATSTKVPASFGLTGSGWGHGVGMSQVGARGMATEGASTQRILKHYYTGTKVQALDDAVPLSVNIAHNAAKVRFRTVALAPHGGALRVVATGGPKLTRTLGGPADRWTATSTPSGITLRRGGKVVVEHTRRVDITWAGTAAPPKHVHSGLRRHAATALSLAASSARVNPGRTYRYGWVTLYWHADVHGHLEAVNVVNLHRDYLRGLGEMPSSWPAAALRAQVDAARSYALVKYRRGVQSVCDCHVDDFHGPFRDQVFAGYSKETSAGGDRWVAAVRATEVGTNQGQVVTYQGAVAQTFYFASSGGRTMSATDVWGTDQPYLRSVDDHWSTETRYNPHDARWGPVVRTESAVATAFGLADVVSIRFTQSKTGVVTAAATSSTGSNGTLSGADLAHRLHLRSVWVRAAVPHR